MQKLYIIKTGTTFASTLETLGDFEEWINNALGMIPVPVEVVDAAGGSALPLPDTCSGVIVTGSHAMVTDNLAWSLRLEAWIPLLVEASVPFLGICYGHQLLGRAMDGVVGYHPLGSEIGTVDIMLASEALHDPLFNALPDRFAAHATHAQSVLTLPPGAVSLASSQHDPFHAFRVGRAAWGVQFHPEYSAAVMQTYIAAQAESLRKSGRNVEQLLHDAAETPHARKVLTNFASMLHRSNNYRSASLTAKTG
ncbi:glutamine amidotransferase [Chlorobium sp. BLA1]|uniref:glutamine amidotransferase n=1 Tax=Candidatus Chlorobium masyuteum TaxID=2716876 RepID=UPI00141DF1B8|nr:glutamine amidotransferase [Candidatus Chlorobium masyuteum]NHQ60741.1 glutamine amidotransferase [Candidatus Chlorobium masyuteum]